MIDLDSDTDSEQPHVSEVESGDGIVRTFDQCQEWASLQGCTLRVATDTELFIDIDTDDQYRVFLKMAHWYNGQHITFNRPTVIPSKSGLPHRHAIVKLRRPTPLLERIAMQATMGSDPMREAISIKRALAGEENVVIFFEKE